MNEWFFGSDKNGFWVNQFCVDWFTIFIVEYFVSFFFSYIRLTCNNNNFIASLCNPNQWQVFVTVAQKQNNSIVVAIILRFFFFHFSFVWFVDEQIYTLNIINNAVILINKSEINLNANAEKSPANS